MSAATPLPSDDGRKIDARVVDQAIDWYVRQASGHATAADAMAFEAWCAAHPEHMRAWQRLQSVGGRFSARTARLPASLARATLEQAGVPPRRRTLKTLAWIGVGGGTIYLAQAQLPWRERLAQSLADARTGIGERRELRLDDETRLLLNTASAVDVRFDAARRLVLLHRGEIMVSTAPDPSGRPFEVRTVDGALVPLGTRFTVRRDDEWPGQAGSTLLGVEAGVVEVRVAGAAPLRVQARQQVRFSRSGIDAPAALDEAAQAWTDGLLTADRMRLADLLAELARYRSGRLRCDPAVADLRVTGVWPLDGPDASERILVSLEQTLPVTVSRMTRYWVTVGPRAPGSPR